MNFGQLLGGAGVVGQGMRQAEEAERVARQNQLAIEEQNRTADLKKQLAGLQMPSFQPVDVAQYTQQFTPGQAMPMGAVFAPAAPAAPAPAPAPAPAAPAAPMGGAVSTPVRPQPNLNAAPLAAQPTSALTVQQFQALPPAERARRLQIENDRRRVATLGAATGKLPAAAADIFTLPITGGASLLQGAANAIDFARVGRAVGLYDPDVTSVTVPFAGSITPYSDRLRQAEAANQPLSEAQFLEQLRQQETTRTQQAAAQRDANVQGAEQQGILPWQLNAKGQPIRGLVNNNPGNIRPDARYQWEGAVGVDKGEKEKAGFVQFATPEAGIRALTMNLMSYDAQGFNTPRAIINRWAPPSDQPGKSNANYIAAVAKALGAKPTDTINLKDPAVMQQLVASIIEFENGKQPYAADVLAAGITAGLNRQPPAAPATAAAPGGIRPMTAAEVARLRQDPYAMGAPSVAAAPGAAPAAAPYKVEIRGFDATPAASGAAPTALEVPQTQARNMEMAEFYLANPESIPYELQQVNQMAQQQSASLTRQRNETAQLAQVYMRSGTQQGIEAAMRLRENLGQLDASLLQIQQQVGQKQAYLQGMQGLRELATANDPRRLSGVLTQFMGTPIGIQPRPDGNYNYFINGKKVRDGVSPAQLAAMALKEFSPEARAASAQSAQLENELALKRKYGDAMVNAMRDIQKAMIDGEYKIAEERAKQLQGKLTIDTSKGVAYFQQGNRVFVINPDGKVEETPLGKVELPPTARPVAGLNMGR